MRYVASFAGRTKGAIGIFYNITAEAEGDTPRAAYLSLYDKYEHIQGIKLYELGENGARRLVPPAEYGRG